eukprot:scaffold10209_cov233-Chaetoceros_neogracile.AAC.4
MNNTTSIQRTSHGANPPLEAIFSGLDSVADAGVISKPLFEDVMSKQSLAYTRLAIGLSFTAVTIYRFTKTG